MIFELVLIKINEFDSMETISSNMKCMRRYHLLEIMQIFFLFNNNFYIYATKDFSGGINTKEKKC